MGVAKHELEEIQRSLLILPGGELFGKLLLVNINDVKK